MYQKQFENDKYTIYSPDSLKYISEDIINFLNDKYESFKKLFNVDYFRKIQINLFDNEEDFRQFIYEIAGDSSMPDYVTSTYHNGMINELFKKDTLVNSIYNNKNIYKPVHELFHIMYNEILLEKNDLKRIVWFDEGMSQLFSGENDNIDFNTWFENIIDKITVIPNLNKINHNGSYVTKKYDGYVLSYIAVKYLYEILGIDKFKLLMKDINLIEKYGETILNEAIEYYKETLDINKTKTF